MNMTQLDDGYWIDHATGSAPLAVRVLASCQAVIRQEAGDRLALVEATMGAMLEGADRATVSGDVFENLMAQVDALDDVTEIDRFRDENDLDQEIPRPLRAFINDNPKALQWRRNLGGPDEIPLPYLSGQGIEASLIRMRPGQSIPDHDHRQEELTLVLSGGFEDGHHKYVRGDVCIAEPGMIHRPRVDDDEACICLTVSLGPLKFKNPLHGAIRNVSRLLPGVPVS